MDDPFWLTLPIKMLVSAALAVIASLLVERSGPLVGGMIATLPLSTGPNYVYLAVEHGPAFLHETAFASLPGHAAMGFFILAYVALAQRSGLAPSLACALAAWALAVFLISRADWSPPGAIALNVMVYVLAIAAVRRIAGHPFIMPAVRRWWDLPLRALVVMVLAAVVLLAGRVAGPTAAGLATLVPVVLTSLILILHNRIGGPATAAVLAHGLPGLLGFGTAILVLWAMVMPFGSAVALISALFVSVGWNASLLILGQSRQRVCAAR